MKKFSFLFVFFSVIVMQAQVAPDSITRRPPLRGLFRWIISQDLYEEGNILNNLKNGEWNKYYQGKLSGKTNYRNGLAISEYWVYNDTLKLRYILNTATDSMNIHDYDVNGRLVKLKKYAVDPRTMFLNYSLMTEDSVFKKIPVTEIKYEYDLWAHRNDIVVVTEVTSGVPNTKYFVLSGNTWQLLWEKNDKGDFIVGKKKAFLKEEEKSKKFLENKEKEKKKTSP